MAFNLEIEPGFWEDFQNAMDYYSKGSSKVPEKLYSELQDALATIFSGPFFQVRYKNFRSYKLQSFPYSIFYTINEKNKMIICYAFVNLHQDSDKYPK